MKVISLILKTSPYAQKNNLSENLMLPILNWNDHRLSCIHFSYMIPRGTVFFVFPTGGVRVKRSGFSTIQPFIIAVPLYVYICHYGGNILTQYMPVSNCEIFQRFICLQFCSSAITERNIIKQNSLLSVRRMCFRSGTRASFLGSSGDHYSFFRHWTLVPQQGRLNFLV
jgi:hypothetical protein